MTEQAKADRGSSCHICGAEAELVRGVRERTMGRLPVLVEDERYRCPECGEEYFTMAQAEASSRAVEGAVHEQHGTLTPSEIRRLRVRLGLTQDEFETLLGVGKKTVVRWETGRVHPNPATASLLRLLDAQPASAQLLSKWHGVELHPAA